MFVDWDPFLGVLRNMRQPLGSSRLLLDLVFYLEIPMLSGPFLGTSEYASTSQLLRRAADLGECLII